MVPCRSAQDPKKRQNLDPQSCTLAATLYRVPAIQKLHLGPVFCISLSTGIFTLKKVKDVQKRQNKAKNA